MRKIRDDPVGRLLSFTLGKLFELCWVGRSPQDYVRLRAPTPMRAFAALLRSPANIN